jgi:two-component system, OmpR family, response regulator RegX3
MRIALLEDEVLQAELLTLWLGDAGHEVLHFASGAAFRAGFQTTNCDLAILDWRLPDDDGVEILAWIRRAVSARLPVMMVTMRDEEAAVVQALDTGADDYVAKPVRRNELVARVRSLARRAEPTPPATALVCGAVTLEPSERRAWVRGQSVTLTDKELGLATCLLQYPGRLLTRQFLLQNIWGTEANADTRTVDTHMSRLRTKLGLVPEYGFELANVYGKGYRLEVLK